MSLIKQALDKARSEEPSSPPLSSESRLPSESPTETSGGEGEDTPNREQQKGGRYWFWVLVLVVLTVLISAQLTYLLLMSVGGT